MWGQSSPKPPSEDPLSNSIVGVDETFFLGSFKGLCILTIRRGSEGIAQDSRSDYVEWLHAGRECISHMVRTRS